MLSNRELGQSAKMCMYEKNNGANRLYAETLRMRFIDNEHIHKKRECAATKMIENFSVSDTQ